MDGVFVIGTDTGVGKTVICAGLMKLIQGSRKLYYWKPIQTAALDGDDTREVKDLTGLEAQFFLEPAYRFPEPVAPILAARKWGKEIDLQLLMSTIEAKKAEKAFIVLEGAGGLLVPYNSRVMQADFIKRTGFPILVVGQDRLGVINQTLLTLRASKEFGIPVLGVVLTRSRGNFGNAECIREFGGVEILAELLPREDKRTIVAETGSHQRLREVFQVKNLPE